MNWPIRYCFLILIICCLLPGWGVGQCTLYGEYSYLEPPTPSGDCWAGGRNPLIIRRRDQGDLRLEDVRATLATPMSYINGLSGYDIEVTRDEYGFKVHLDSVGRLYLYVSVEEGVDTLCTRIVPLPVVPAVGSFNSRIRRKESAVVFKCQRGVSIVDDNTPFNAKFACVSYDLIRVGVDGTSQRASNRGGEWGEETRKLISLAKPGDVYVFRNIRYRSPGIEKLQVAEPLIIELK